MTIKKRILFVCMENSIHSVKWINAIAETNLYEIYIFPVGIEYPSVDFSSSIQIFENKFVKLFNNLISHGVNSNFCFIRYVASIVKVFYKSFLYRFTYRVGSTEIRLSIFNTPKRLNSVIQKLKPNLIHALEFQHAGYLLNAAYLHKLSEGRDHKFAISNWGSDINFYKNQPGHNEVISEVLRHADYLFVECERDAKYAVDDFGFSGPIFKCINSVGIDFNRIKHIDKLEKNSDRRIILVKGYETKFGRASLAFEAIENCAEMLRRKNYEVWSYSVSAEAKKIIEKINQNGLIAIKTLPQMSNAELINIFSKSQIYIGISLSDGISISCLEAMATGAIPVQTDTSCCHEWLTNKLGGFIIPLSVEAIEISLIKIISGNFDGNNAASINYNIVLKEANYHKNSKKIQNFYYQIFSDQHSIR